ncbi:MAG: hypothetical protein Q4G05_03585 [Clostridia bacterium]|nr:hypothetical protein [Clostridia bacterium]
MKTSYEQIVKIDNNDVGKVLKLAFQEDHIYTGRNLLLCIDFQNDFVEGGSLAVPGAKADIARLTKWIYNNMQDISEIICTMDTHVPEQIFHPCWWEDTNGKNPNPYTIITLDDFNSGKWKLPKNLKMMEGITKQYLEHLEKNSKKQLCIWPYHCLWGTEGANLEQSFSQMVIFHYAVTGNDPRFIEKGKLLKYSEMYGFIEPEFGADSSQNQYHKNLVNKVFLDRVIKGEYDNIYIAGEAASHCVLESVTQLCKKLQSREYTERIVILEDCMTSIAGFEKLTTQKFKELQEMYGIRFVKSTEMI